MLSKNSTLLARQFFRRRRQCARPISSFPSNPPPSWHNNASSPRESHRTGRTPWSEREYDPLEPSGQHTQPTTSHQGRPLDRELNIRSHRQTRPSAPRHDPAVRYNLPSMRHNPPGIRDESLFPPAVLDSVRTAHGLTIRIHNVPREALISEVLDFVLAGPIFRTDDYVQRYNDSRVVAVTFFHSADALAFHQDATKQEINLFGHRPKFVWAVGTSPRWHPTLGRSLIIHDKGDLGTEEDLQRYLSRFGPIDRISLMKSKSDGDRAFVNYLSAESAPRAAKELREAGADVNLVSDRSSIAARARNDALRSHSRTIALRGIPTQTSLPELTDQIRGGAIQRINFVPESGVAFVHFVEHSAAAYFLQHAVYRGIVIHGRRLSATFQVKSEPLPPHVVQDVELGATRCLGIEGILNPAMLREDCLQYGNVENITFSESMSNVTFTNIQHAVRASRMLPTKVGYQGLEVKFVADPCAAPYPRDMREAAALQAHISSLLIPAKAHESPAYGEDDDLGSLLDVYRKGSEVFRLD